MHPETIAFLRILALFCFVLGVSMLCCAMCMWLMYLITSNDKLRRRMQTLCVQNIENHAKIVDLERENAELKKAPGL